MTAFYYYAKTSSACENQDSKFLILRSQPFSPTSVSPKNYRQQWLPCWRNPSKQI